MKIPKVSKQILFLIILVLGMGSCGLRNEESVYLSEFLVEQRRAAKLYFYPSTIRMLGKIMGNESVNATNEIKNGKLVFSWSEEHFDLSSFFSEISDGLQGEGYDQIIQVKSKESAYRVFFKEGNDAMYVVLVENDYGDFVIEMVGSLSYSGLMELSKMDFREIADTFGVARQQTEKSDTTKVDSTAID